MPEKTPIVIDLEKSKADFNKLDQNFASLKSKINDKINKIKADITPDGQDSENPLEELQEICQYLCNMVDYSQSSMINMQNQMWDNYSSLSSRIYDAHNKVDTHANSPSHVPPLSPTCMAKLISSCGADGDYQVNPKQITYANKNIILASYQKPAPKQ